MKAGAGFLAAFLCAPFGLSSAYSETGALEWEKMNSGLLFERGARTESAVSAVAALELPPTVIRLTPGPSGPKYRIAPPEPRRHEKKGREQGRAIGFISMGIAIVIAVFAAVAVTNTLAGNFYGLFLFYPLTKAAEWIGGHIGGRIGRRRDGREFQAYLLAKRGEWRQQLSEPKAAIVAKKSANANENTADKRFKL